MYLLCGVPLQDLCLVLMFIGGVVTDSTSTAIRPGRSTVEHNTSGKKKPLRISAVSPSGAYRFQ